MNCLTTMILRALIKKWENRANTDIPKFVSDMELHDKQRDDISRAFCGPPGLHIVKDKYAEFAKGTEFWKLDQCAREKYLTKISALPLISPQSKDPLEPFEQLSVSFFPSEVSI